jgi:hypothetical protein
MKLAFDELRVRWHGESPLAMHNGRLADPLDPIAKQMKKISAKRKKTDEDLLDLAKIEYTGSLYFDENLGPVVPVHCILATIVNGGRKTKIGKEVALAVFAQGLNGHGDSGVIELQYDGPRDVESLWSGGAGRHVFKRSVVVQRARVMRYAPIFPEWALEFLVKFDAQIINKENVIKAMQDGGLYIGLCECRPRKGRFSVEILS